MKKIPTRIQKKVKEIIQDAVNQSIANEEAERASGKILEDNPVCRLLTTFAEAITPPKDCLLCEAITLKEVTPTGISIVATGETTYLTSRRMWKAYEPLMKLVLEEEIDEESLYSILHYVPGVGILARYGEKVLMGVRSDKLAGTHVGMASIPAGLMRPRETVGRACFRELEEETGLRPLNLAETPSVIRMGYNPKAPNPTFVCCVEVAKSDNLKETYEAKGKRFIWVEIATVLYPALQGQTGNLVMAFRRQGIEVGDDLQIAPEIAQGLKKIFRLG